MTDLHALIHRMADELDHYRQLLTDDRRELHPLATEARAALSEPEPASLEQGVQQMHPFVVRHYTEDERPTIKGNGFDGLEIGEDREEAEAFVAWINEKLARWGQ